MAQTLFSDEERDRRIDLIGEYRELTGESIRNIAKHFSSTQFKISNATVSDYLERYKKKYPDKKDIIERQASENIPNTVKDPQIKIRVLKIANLIIYGCSIEEVTEKTKIPYWVVYRDIKNRLPMIDKKMSDEINRLLQKRSMENLKKQNDKRM